MNNTNQIDIAVIGGGIVGCATAAALSEIPGTSVAIIEKENRLAPHQTGNNSGVIHSGLYYKPGSLKAVNCAQGRELLYRFCQENHIRHEQCGKIVIATRDEELGPLEILEQRGEANGLKGLRRIGPEEIKEREPNINGIAGLIVPETGIVDFVAVTQALAHKMENRGGAIYLNTKLNSVKRETRGLVLETTQGTIHTRNLINCAGLHSDRISQLCHVPPDVQIVPFRGEYYELIPERRQLINHLVYPVPDPRFPFLGVHFTRMVQGGVEAGPNAVLALNREGYTWKDLSIRDICTYLFFPGFWRMSRRYWRIGFKEVYRSLRKKAFVNDLRRLLPSLEVSDVRAAGAGVRAQALAPSGKLLDDFRIVTADRMIQVLNAPSPAATASISIGRTIAQMAQEQFDF